ncbi:hypothetical protein EWS90_01935 [Pseudomonas aeruginosa]|uniref:hypothetical protein n=1 Tax=Pseudomonas aeruginosa TaxID=287 RepID=UPI00101AFE7E|nr:hypothetical protein [Pseudomonas aeruginosa]QBC05415.1 hypothetical protein EWS90_01935 [Pseudomonas aeruginosa]
MSKELNKALDLLREIRPSIPKDVLELWCKDRDAFLASHKAPVEQAGANVGHGHVFPRADGVKMRCGGPGLCSECAADAYRARAALAQPSPKCVKCGGTGEADSGGVHPWGEPVLIPCDCETEQAEAERPEVAEVAFVLRNIGAMDAEDIDGDNVDLRFEDAEGRDTGCDVSIVEYAEKAADLFEQHDRIVGELRADRDSWAEQAEQRLADWDEMRKERDAALAEVKRIKTISDNYYALCVERQQQLDAALAMVSGLRSLLNPILCYVENDIERMRGDRDKSDNKETYDLAISLAMKRLKAAQHAVFTTEPGCNTAVELASHITAQAQHSVPVVTPEMVMAAMAVFRLDVSPFKSMEAALIAALRKAAAPGKEVGHE